MTPSYREAKAHVETLPPEQQDAYLRKLWAYKHEVELAGAPWSILTYVAYFLGFGLLMFSRELPGPDWLGLTVGAVVLLAGMPLQQLAQKKKRAYQHAHPFEV